MSRCGAAGSWSGGRGRGRLSAVSVGRDVAGPGGSGGLGGSGPRPALLSLSLPPLGLVSLAAEARAVRKYDVWPLLERLKELGLFSLEETEG